MTLEQLIVSASSLSHAVLIIVLMIMKYEYSIPQFGIMEMCSKSHDRYTVPLWFVR